MPIVPTLTAPFAIPAQPTKPFRPLVANVLDLSKANASKLIASGSNPQGTILPCVVARVYPARVPTWTLAAQPALTDGGQPKA